MFRDELPRCTQESCQDSGTPASEDTDTTMEGEGGGSDGETVREEKTTTIKGLVKPGVCMHACVCGVVWYGVLCLACISSVGWLQLNDHWKEGNEM